MKNRSNGSLSQKNIVNCLSQIKQLWRSAYVLVASATAKCIDVMDSSLRQFSSARSLSMVSVAVSTSQEDRRFSKLGTTTNFSLTAPRHAMWPLSRSSASTYTNSWQRKRAPILYSILWLVTLRIGILTNFLELSFLVMLRRNNQNGLSFSLTRKSNSEKSLSKLAKLEDPQLATISYHSRKDSY